MTHSLTSFKFLIKVTLWVGFSLIVLFKTSFCKTGIGISYYESTFIFLPLNLLKGTIKDYKESWVLKDWCFWTAVLEKILESPLNCKEIQPVHPKGNQSWIFIGRTDVEAEAPILGPPDVKNWVIWKRPWCWERLKAGGEGDDRGWDGWMVSLTQWTWVCASSESWWWIGKAGMPQSIGSQRVRHEWATELN